MQSCCRWSGWKRLARAWAGLSCSLALPSVSPLKGLLLVPKTLQGINGRDSVITAIVRARGRVLSIFTCSRNPQAPCLLSRYRPAWCSPC